LLAPALLRSLRWLEAVQPERLCRQGREQRPLPFCEQRLHLLFSALRAKLLEQHARRLEQPRLFPI
jgi:hypothetical protein